MPRSIHDMPGTAVQGRSSTSPARLQQPWKGWIGIFVVLALFALGGFALSPQGSLLVVGPISTFAMPVLGTVADFWVPKRSKRYSSMLMNVVMTLVVLVGAVALTLFAQVVVGHLDLVGAFSSSPTQTVGHLTIFPYTIPLGAFMFVLYLEVSIVSEGGTHLGKYGTLGALLTLVGCILCALILYLVFANWESVPEALSMTIGLRDPGGPFPALSLASWLISITIWQSLYGPLSGWPYGIIQRRWLRLCVANIGTIALGSITYFLMHTLVGLSDPQIAALGAMVVVGTSTTGTLFNNEPQRNRSATARVKAIVLALGIAAVCYIALREIGLRVGQWNVAPVELWMTISGLNLIGGGVTWYSRVITS